VFLACSSPAFSQSAYLAGSIGADRPFLTSVKVDGQTRIDPGTALAFGVRAGLPLGVQWGAEVEFSRGTAVIKDERAGRGLFGPTSVLGAGLFDIGSLPSTSPGYELLVHATYRNASIDPLVWFTHPLSNRLDLAFIGGIAFNRLEADERYEVIALRPNLSFSFTVRPISLHTVQYRVGALAGIETRVAMGDHVRVIPGVRIHGVGSGWAVRPAVSVGWLF
jgi:hypothetical protein